jgi:hypothetical protein
MTGWPINTMKHIVPHASVLADCTVQVQCGVLNKCRKLRRRNGGRRDEEQKKRQKRWKDEKDLEERRERREENHVYLVTCTVPSEYSCSDPLYY